MLRQGGWDVVVDVFDRAAWPGGLDEGRVSVATLSCVRVDREWSQLTVHPSSMEPYLTVPVKTTLSSVLNITSQRTCHHPSSPLTQAPFSCSPYIPRRSRNSPESMSRIRFLYPFQSPGACRSLESPAVIESPTHKMRSSVLGLMAILGCAEVYENGPVSALGASKLAVVARAMYTSSAAVRNLTLGCRIEV